MLLQLQERYRRYDEQAALVPGAVQGAEEGDWQNGQFHPVDIWKDARKKAAAFAAAVSCLLKPDVFRRHFHPIDFQGLQSGKER